MLKYAKTWAAALLVLVAYCAITTAIEAREAHTERCIVVHCT